MHEALNTLNIKKEFPSLIEESQLDEDEQIFLSDNDDEPTIKAFKPPAASKTKGNASQADRPIYDKLVKKVKFEEDHIGQAKRPLDDSVKEQQINSVEKIEERLEQLKTKYSIDHVILKFKQAEIFIEKQEHEQLIQSILEPLKSALELEVELQTLKRKVLSKYLYQSQKKNFKKKMEYGIEFNEDEEAELLFKSKKSKMSCNTCTIT